MFDTKKTKRKTDFYFISHKQGNLETDTYLQEHLMEIKLQVAGNASERHTHTLFLSISNTWKMPLNP